MSLLRLAFFGTSNFSVPILAELSRTGHKIVAVYTQPPRPSGRGQKERPSPVHAWAKEHSLPIYTPKTLRDGNTQTIFKALELDAAVVAAYGLILPKQILEAPRHGCINVHASLLPRWRGAAPIQRAILAGDTETGITIMLMEEGLDTGPSLRMERLPITRTMHAGSLHDILSELGGRLIEPVLTDYVIGRVKPVPQQEHGATYANKFGKVDMRINWAESAVHVDRQIRAFSPLPGSWFDCFGERIKVQECIIVEGHGAPGTVLDDKFTVACGEGAIQLTRLQRPGKRSTDAKQFMRGYPVAKGVVL